MIAARQIFLGRGGAKLPYDAEVEYLESTETQWIGTGWTPDLRENLKIIGKAGFNTTSRGMLISAYANEARANFALELYQDRILRPYIIGDIGRVETHAELRKMFDYDLIYTFSDGVIRASANGYSNSGVVPSQLRRLNTLPALIGSDYRHIYMCGIYGPMKIYNPDLVRDFIPVRFTNDLGQSEGAMYDRVSKRLFRNAGKGSFRYGADVYAVPVETSQYVQDGLIAMWDGIENAGVGKHSPNTTTWKDLIGGGLSQFSAAPSWAQNGLSIVPSNNTLTFNSPDALLALASSGFSIEIVAYMQALATTRFNYIVDSTTSSNTISIFTHDVSAMFILQKLGSHANVVAYGNNVTFPDSASCATVYDAGLSVNNSKFYRDGEYTTARSNTSTLSPSSLYAIMRSNGPTGIYHSLRIYNRALTAEEIAANYAVDKARFNLP